MYFPFLDEAPVLPPRIAATEAFGPNVVRARRHLTPRGIELTEYFLGP
ncbi:hypothetical protein [Brevibacterium zhoupengii]|nr:hypothetical protein [Brevibacterium zhoupengii]